jgi:hypothetical protein
LVALWLQKTRGERTELTARAQHFPAFAFSDEDVKPTAGEDALEPQGRLIGRSSKRTAGKFIKRNQINLTADVTHKIGKS